MAYETIIAQTLDGHVGRVTLNRAEAMNTFSSQMAEELYDALKEFESDSDVRVILIKGAGRAFCAGIDVNELKGKTTNQYREWIEKMEAPLVLISKLKTPVIAQVHGAAAANGMGLGAGFVASGVRHQRRKLRAQLLQRLLEFVNRLVQRAGNGAGGL